MLPIGLHQVRLFLHVLAATVWVGGQLTLAGLVPGSGRCRRMRRAPLPAGSTSSRGRLRCAGAHRDLEPARDRRREHQQQLPVTLAVKLGAVVLSGVAAALHMWARSKAGLAVWGALSAVGALAALFFGVVLHG